MAAEIKYAAFYEMIIQAFRGKVIGSGDFRVITEMV